MKRLRLLRLWMAGLALWGVGWSTPRVSTPRERAIALLDQLSPAQRVGQLFVVSAEGASVEEGSPLMELVRAGAVSGVLLSAEGGNFAPLGAAEGSTQAMISALQQASTVPTSPDEPEAAEGFVPVPPFIAVRIQADGVPWWETLADYPPLPSQMAIGATWDPDLAREVGVAVGQHFGQLGVNLLIGPSLDVLADPRLGGPHDLGVAVFGGDPFWVGLLGKAYVEGIHSGSAGRVGVVVTHFPGLGASDRDAAVELATVRRTLDQLRGFELQPFAAVAASEPGSDAGTADGMLTAHIRFQGLQGNIRDTTQPVSLDAEAFEQLTATEPFASWRRGGGVMVSDSLGSKAVRRFIDPSEATFPAATLARDAFLAGNDLLLLEDFRGPADPDAWATIQRTLAYFVQRYQDDPVFAQRVDDAALRVLMLKLRLSGGSYEGREAGDADGLGGPGGRGNEVSLRVARAAATLVSPSLEEMRARLGKGPQLTDRMVIFTDIRRAKACAACSPVPGLDAQAFEKVILSLYGGADAQIRSWNVTSFSTPDLAAYLGEAAPTDPTRPIAHAEDVDTALKTADWIVFLVERERPEEFGSDALRLLLNRRPELFARRKLVVFALDVPYDLDATDVSKIDALYALYSRGSEFLNIAARLLFQEMPATGALPVSVPAIGYDLIEALSPDPDQVIELSVSLTGAPDATPDVAGFRVNDTISIATGVLVDCNGHPVPDGTPVEFSLGYPGELPATVKSSTRDGVANIEATLGRLGLLSITVQSEPARSSTVVQLNVQENAPAFVTVIAPTAVPTITVEATGATPTSAHTSAQGGDTSQARGLGLGALLIGLIGAAGVAGLAYSAGSPDEPISRARCVLVAMVSSLLGYNYIALGFPGAEAVLRALGAWAPGLVGVATGLVAWGMVQIWLAIWRRRAGPPG